MLIVLTERRSQSDGSFGQDGSGEQRSRDMSLVMSRIYGNLDYRSLHLRAMQHPDHDLDALSPAQNLQQHTQPRPPPQTFPTQRQPNRAQGGAPRNTLSGILSNRPGNAPIPPSLQAKMTAVRLSVSLSPFPDLFQMLNRGSPGSPSTASFSIDSAAHTLQRTGFDDLQRPLVHQPNSFPPSSFRGRGTTPGPPAKRNKPGFKLSDMHPDAAIGAANAGLGAGRPSLADVGRRTPSTFDTPFANFNKIVYVVSLVPHPCVHNAVSDPSGRLNFAGKAVLHASGVDFSNGSSFAINMEQLILEHELGRGNYGTVKKVLHKPTNVALAMKVFPCASYTSFNHSPLSFALSLGNSLRARLHKAQRHPYGA